MKQQYIPYILTSQTRSRGMSRLSKLIIPFLVSIFCGCNDYLDIKPNNEQVTTDYWQTKEDVEAVVAAGYYYMRTCVPTFIKWGELRGGSMYSTNTTNELLQDFNMTASVSLCDYSAVYKVINMANSVIKYAPGVRALDNTYYESVMDAHLCEAYFQRAYCYLILVKNYKEVPLITQPYVDDTESFDQAKATEYEIVAQIKSDIITALSTGAAKGTYESDWQTKGRATKWALYALMADVCLWSEDYSTAIDYCNLILNATDSFRPVFITNTSDWYTLFYPGNSNESIFELNWDYNTNLETNNFSTSLFAQSVSATIRFTSRAIEKLREETQTLYDAGMTDDARMGRMLLATYVPSTGVNSGWQTSSDFYMWKYYGTDVQDITGGARTRQDANFILYRVAEIILMKAQAEVMEGNYLEALTLINRIRNRAGLENYDGIDTEDDDSQSQAEQLDELTLLEEILNQKEMEFFGEAKRWYDLLWFGRVDDSKYKPQFITKVIEGNQTTNSTWIYSVLQDQNAWYMPLPEDDILHNKSLVQNPYYASN